MSEACARSVERADPKRFRAALACPPQARAPLLVLYAFNLEVARAPWLTTEPMIAEMRLQWWRDAVADAATGVVRAHEVMAPLADLMASADLPVEVMDRLIEARRWDIYKEAFEDEAAFDAYIEDSAAGLMWLCAKALNAPPEAEAMVRAMGWASGLATYLQAVPDLEARGRIPLLDGRAAEVGRLAQRGLDRLAMARGARPLLPKAAQGALLAGWQAGALLQLARAEPQRVAEGTLQLSEFKSRGLLLWQALTGRF
jgi:15-cis-phytoene synthase